MNKRKSVFVIGAGASNEIGLPLGLDLKRHISKALDIKYADGGYTKVSGSDLIDSAFRTFAKEFHPTWVDINSYIHVGWMIRDAMSQAASIDNYMEAHRDNELLIKAGKLAIAESILNAERASSLYLKSNNHSSIINFSLLEGTWYKAFFQMIIEGCQVDKIADRLSSIAIVTFNYDRCIEYFLHHSLRNYYQISSEEAVELMRNLKIFHPYGHLGDLSWPHRHPFIEFGAKPNTQQLIEISRGLKTFTEGTDTSSSEILDIRSNIKNAEILTFLGFAFSRQNLALLYSESSKKTKAKTKTNVYGTATGISDSNLEAIVDELVGHGGYDPVSIKLRNDLTCYKLFDEFGRRLSLA